MKASQVIVCTEACVYRGVEADWSGGAQLNGAATCANFCSVRMNISVSSSWFFWKGLLFLDSQPLSVGSNFKHCLGQRECMCGPPGGGSLVLEKTCSFSNG